MFYICNTKSAPLRKDARHSAEMTSEILYGEFLIPTGKEEDEWLEVQCEWDDYEGWISKGQVTEVNDTSGRHIWGLDLPDSFYPGSMVAEDISMPIFSWDLFREKYIDVPYYWGGRSTAGIDCSGLSQIYYKLHGVRIPRDASMQAMCGEDISDLDDCKPGDLAFFENKDAKITHVGILMDSHKIMHSTSGQGRVVIDTIDKDGIINSQTGGHSHNLAKMVRIYFDSDHLL